MYLHAHVRLKELATSIMRSAILPSRASRAVTISRIGAMSLIMVWAQAHTDICKRQRHVNIKGVQPYIDAALQRLPRLSTALISEQEAMEDFMMVGLRLLDGVRDRDFELQFPGHTIDGVFGTQLEPPLQEGLLQRTEGEQPGVLPGGTPLRPGSGYRLTLPGRAAGQRGVRRVHRRAERERRSLARCASWR